MILCVYHGSTFRGVNETQTAYITKCISERFTEQQVIPCYYSSHVLAVMNRRMAPLLSFTDALNAGYRNSQSIYVLITNMIAGREYQQILKTIKAIDVERKVHVTEYLLAEKNVYNIAECLVNKQNPTLFVGHGMIKNNRDYERLNELLMEEGNIVTTLDADLKAVMDMHFISKRLIVRPLMLTSGYHVKLDIERTMKDQLIELGYKPIIDLRPLAQNDKIVELLINSLAQLIEETESGD